MSEAEEKGKIETRQAAADSVKKNRNRNDEGDSGGGGCRSFKQQ